MCDFCNKTKPKDWGKDIFTKNKEFKNEIFDTVPDMFIKGNKLIIEYDAYSCDSSFCDEIEIKFCPMCGSSLNAL